MKTVLIFFFTIFCLSVNLRGEIPNTIHHQGRVAVNGLNFDGAGAFRFLIFTDADANPSSGNEVAVWKNDNGAPGNLSMPATPVTVLVRKGLYAVPLGGEGQSALPALLVPPTGRRLYLRIWFDNGVNGVQLLSPDQELAAVPFALHAASVQSIQISNSNGVTWGSGNMASGTAATAWGSGTQATFVRDTAWGFNTVASGGTSTAWGVGAAASGPVSTAWGTDTVASGGTATAWGVGTEATGDGTTAWGTNTNAIGLVSTAWGSNTNAIGTLSTAWGGSTLANASQATAWGNSTEARGINSTAFGEFTDATGHRSTAWGVTTLASGNRSTAWGDNTVAGGDASTAWGNHASAFSFAETAFGQFNSSYTPVSTTSWFGQDRLFVIGNGLNDASRSDALVMLKNGDTAWNGNMMVDGSLSAATLTTDGSYRFTAARTGRLQISPAQFRPGHLTSGASYDAEGDVLFPDSSSTEYRYTAAIQLPKGATLIDVRFNVWDEAGGPTLQTFTGSIRSRAAGDQTAVTLGSVTDTGTIEPSQAITSFSDAAVDSGRQYTLHFNFTASGTSMNLGFIGATVTYTTDTLQP